MFSQDLLLENKKQTHTWFSSYSTDDQMGRLAVSWLNTQQAPNACVYFYSALSEVGVDFEQCTSWSLHCPQITLPWKVSSSLPITTQKNLIIPKTVDMWENGQGNLALCALDKRTCHWITEYEHGQTIDSEPGFLISTKKSARWSEGQW
jgi:hypothetical protein